MRLYDLQTRWRELSRVRQVWGHVVLAGVQDGRCAHSRLPRACGRCRMSCQGEIQTG